jgi:hypothetical protein
MSTSRSRRTPAKATIRFGATSSTASFDGRTIDIPPPPEQRRSAYAKERAFLLAELARQVCLHVGVPA